MFMGPSVDPEGKFCAVGILLERLLSSLGFLGHPPCFFLVLSVHPTSNKGLCLIELNCAHGGRNESTSVILQIEFSFAVLVVAQTDSFQSMFYFSCENLSGHSFVILFQGPYF